MSATVRFALRIVLACGLAGIAGVSFATSPVVQADQLYAAGRFGDAIAAYERALAQAPWDAELHRRLGRSYGRHAEQSNAFVAFALADSARQHFERAAELAPSDVEALSDLLRFYFKAPAIIGGGRDKARAIVEQLDAIDALAAREARDWMQRQHD